MKQVRAGRGRSISWRAGPGTSLAMPAEVPSDVDGLVACYTAAGGIATGDELAGMVGRCIEQPLSHVAGWIVRRQVVSFVAHGSILLPLFQFNPREWVVREPVQRMLADLGDGLDDLGVAAWFAAPHPGLRGRSPLQVVRRISVMQRSWGHDMH